jgi:hypothetical protein
MFGGFPRYINVPASVLNVLILVVVDTLFMTSIVDDPYCKKVMAAAGFSAQESIPPLLDGLPERSVELKH